MCTWLIHHGSDLVYINSGNRVIFPSYYESIFFFLYPLRPNAWARSQSQDGPCSHMTSWWRHDSETFPRYWPFVRGIHWSAVDSLHNEPNNGELFYVRIYKWLTRQWGSYPDSEFMRPTWGPPGSCGTQMAPMLAPWTLLSGYSLQYICNVCSHCLRPRSWDARHNGDDWIQVFGKQVDVDYQY